MKSRLRAAVSIPALAVPALLLGCEAAPAIRPGLAALRIEVVARPKAGYRAPAEPPYGGSDASDRRYARVNYARLENVIVWVEPEGHPGAQREAAESTRIRLVRPGSATQMPWYVVSADTAVVLQNANPGPERFYSVSDGNHFDTGDLASNAEATVMLHRVANHEARDPREAATQVVEVFSTRHEEPLAGIVVAPTIWAASTRSGRAVTFTNLPPGAVRVVCWHPRLPGAEQRIQLSPDALTRTRISIGVDSLPDAP